MEKWHLNQKILCIRTSSSKNKIIVGVEQGKEYTIIGINPSPCCKGKILLLVAEVDNDTECPIHGNYHKAGYSSERFVPKEELHSVTFTQIQEEINVPQSVN